MVTGAELVGWRYRGPFDDLEPGAGVEHRIVPWDEVSLEEGTGIVHIAPGCGAEDFESKVHGLPVLTPVDEAGAFYDDYGWLPGLTTTRSRARWSRRLRERGLLVRAATIRHRYPHCWRCDTPLIFRLSDDWFIAVAEVREPLLEANARSSGCPSTWASAWTTGCATWGTGTSPGAATTACRCPSTPAPCGHLNVIGSQSRAGRTLGQLPQGLRELRRPWIDGVRIGCEECGEPVERVPEVGDVWLDAGIVPFSTLGWQNPSAVRGGYGDGAAAGLTGADLPDHAYWEEWFPADWVTEMREQIRLWFYSQLFMSVTLTGVRPTEGARLREDARQARPRDARLVGQHDRRGGRVRPDGRGRDALAVLRAAAQPGPALRLRPGHEIKRKLLTLWNCVSSSSSTRT